MKTFCTVKVYIYGAMGFESNQELFTDIRLLLDEVSGEHGVGCPSSSQQFQLPLFLFRQKRVDVLCFQSQVNEGPRVLSSSMRRQGQWGPVN